MKLLFLDESGNHSLESIDQSYPVFVLGGIIVDRSYYRTVMEPRIQTLKEKHFGSREVILHTTDIIRGRNGFESLNDADARAAFYDDLNAAMRELEYSVLACAIRKEEHVRVYGKHAVDPYMYSLEIVLERFCHEVGDIEHGGMVFAERRRVDIDDALDAQWKRFREQGTDFVSREMVDKRIVDLSLKSKKLNMAGLQLADLVVSPIGRHVIGKPAQEDWSIVERKFRRRGAVYAGYGLVILPGTR